MVHSVSLGLNRFTGDPPPLVALHGFTQTGAMFGELAGLLDCEVRAPDLPGHGRSSEVTAAFDGAVAGVVEVLEAIDRPAPLLGYSQGARIAMGVAIERPDLISRLVLVSASPGLASDSGREQRRLADETLAVRLTSVGLPAFLDEWMAQPMFRGLQRRGEEWLTQDRALRLANRPAGLAAALRGMGQGVQPYLGDRLTEVAIPVLLIVGADDDRYVNLAEDMLRDLPDVVLEVVSDCGHPVIGERPETVAGLVDGFLAGDG
jgi:2-succinyl-6-hydroxy-2,4-cyclohexadiene-1-carboxylate synthase